MIKDRKSPVRVKCLKNLWKSTYQKNAFIKNRTYTVSEIDRANFIYVVDEQNHEFSFHKDNDAGIYYKFDEYFKYV